MPTPKILTLLQLLWLMALPNFPHTHAFVFLPYGGFPPRYRQIVCRIWKQQQSRLRLRLRSSALNLEPIEWHDDHDDQYPILPPLKEPHWMTAKYQPCWFQLDKDFDWYERQLANAPCLASRRGKAHEMEYTYDPFHVGHTFGRCKACGLETSSLGQLRGFAPRRAFYLKRNKVTGEVTKSDAAPPKWV